jgi:CHAT domain-containing protein
MKKLKDTNFTKIATFSNNEITNKSRYRYLYLSFAVILCITIPLFIPNTIIGAEASLTSSQLNILLDRADNAYVSGNYQEAVSIWLKIVEEQKPKSNQLAVVYANLASVYWHTGRTGEAVKYWQESLEIYREIKTNKSDEKIAATLVDTARAYNDLGQPRFSIPLVTEAISIAKKKELAKVKGMAYLTLGNARTIQGNYSSAINAYQSGLKNINRADSDLSIVVGNNLSKAYQQRALITRQDAIAVEENEGLPASKLWQQVKSDRASAWQAANQATKIRENSQSIAQVEALLQLAKLAKDDATKSFDTVNSLLKAEVILSALPDSQQKVYALIELSKLTDDYDLRSKLILDSAVKTSRKIDNPRVASFAFGAMGKHYESQQQYDKALYWTKQAQFTAQQAQALDSLYQWDWQAARIYNATDETEAAIEAYERAIASLQSIRTNTSQSQGDPLSEFQSDLEPIYRGLIQLLLSNNSGNSDLRLALETKDLLLLSELENFFQDDCFRLEAFTETDKLAYLKKTNTVVINTIVLNDKTYVIWQLPDGKFKKYAVNISQKQLQQLVNQWRFDLENKENDNYLALSQQLYKLFFPSEIESYLKTSKLQNLIFANDGILRNVPMAALHNGDKFLVENYAVVNSLGLNIQAKQPKPKIEKALAFGLTTGVNQFPPLPYVEQEIEQLGKIVDEQEFFNDKFTKKNFQQQIESNKSSLVHVATHGRFGGNRENTFLQAYQSQINLTELEEILSTHNLNFPDDPILLLVLSACDTAAGDPRATLGMSGVAVRSGVDNTLGSLWSVNDQQIVTLINGFYNNWIKDELSLPEALRQAQLDLIKSPDYHPSNWSSMILLQ